MNKKNILIVCALEVETQEQLDDWAPFADDPVWDVLYTGVGKINATIRLVDRFSDYNIMKPDLVINYGTAGSQHWKYKKGDLVDCTRFVQRDMDVTPLGFKLGQTPFEEDIPIILQSESEFNPIGKKALCGSGDSFVQDKTMGDVVDMESYALAKVCKLYDVPFISFKYITDTADPDASNDWEENVGNGIIKFKKEIVCEL
jgi:adenosylhomocysteine nucleosidase